MNIIKYVGICLVTLATMNALCMQEQQIQQKHDPLEIRWDELLGWFSKIKKPGHVLKEDVQKEQADGQLTMCGCFKEKRIQLVNDMVASLKQQFGDKEELCITSYGTGGWWKHIKQEGQVALLQEFLLIQAILKAWGDKPLTLTVNLIGPDLYQGPENVDIPRWINHSFNPEWQRSDKQLDILNERIREFIDQHDLTDKYVSVNLFETADSYLRAVREGHAQKSHLIYLIDAPTFVKEGPSNPIFNPNMLGLPGWSLYKISFINKPRMGSKEQMPHISIHQDNEVLECVNRFLADSQDKIFWESRWKEFEKQKESNSDQKFFLFTDFLKSNLLKDYECLSELVNYENLENSMKELIELTLEQDGLVFMLNDIKTQKIEGPQDFEHLMQQPDWHRTKTLNFQNNEKSKFELKSYAE